VTETLLTARELADFFGLSAASMLEEAKAA
jgi:hypothetical protein